MTPNFHEIAIADLRSHVSAVYESCLCDACKAPKWKHFPFCRSCSIRLQRCLLLRRLLLLARHSPCEPGGEERHCRFWDLCRDFLINGKLKIKREEYV